MKKGDKIRFNGHQGNGSFTYEATTVGKIYEITDMSRNPLYEGRAYYKGDDGATYVWKRDREDIKNDFTLVQAEQLEPKVGDKIRFNGYEDGRLSKNLTIGKEYKIIRKDFAASEFVVIKNDIGQDYVWSHTLVGTKTFFTLVPTQNTAIPTAGPAERDPNTLQEGDIIKFMGTVGEVWDCYRDTTVGKEYTIYRVVLDVDGNVQRVRYLDDNNDAISWYPHKHEQMYHFKVMTEGRLYKDDVLATAPTLQDLQNTLDMALLLNDIQWAQETYEQIQQMEGEHA